MALSFDKIKKDFARHQKRALILGVLVLVLLGFVFKAYFEMAPKAAEADSTATVENTEATASAADTEVRIRQSKELWKTLRETQGVPPAAAFSFLPSYYNRDPSRPVRDLDRDAVKVTPQMVQTPQTNEQFERDARAADIKKQSLKLTVMSTIVGNGNSSPVAVINQRILSVGDTIEGFEIVAIKAREVVFKMDGVVLPVKMASAVKAPVDDAHGQ